MPELSWVMVGNRAVEVKPADTFGHTTVTILASGPEYRSQLQMLRAPWLNAA